jgi:hypothetical protein
MNLAMGNVVKETIWNKGNGSLAGFGGIVEINSSE